MSLRDIVNQYGSDKSEREHYITQYVRNFEQYRHTAKRVLEIGIYKGESLKIWRDYFPNAEIIGIDINPRWAQLAHDPGNRITGLTGDCGSSEFFQGLVAGFGHFDIVIDDGSHKGPDIRVAHNHLYPITKMCYCIEDLGTQHEAWSNREYTQADGDSAIKNLIQPHVHDMMNPKVEALDCKEINIGKWQVFYHK